MMGIASLRCSWEKQSGWSVPAQTTSYGIFIPPRCFPPRHCLLGCVLSIVESFIVEATKRSRSNVFEPYYL